MEREDEALIENDSPNDQVVTSIKEMFGSPLTQMLYL